MFVINKRLDMNSFYTKIKPKLFCCKPDHMREEISYICMDDNCSNHQFSCYLCLQENHKSHQLTNIKMLISQILQIEAISQQTLIKSAELDQKVNRIREVLEQSKIQFHNYQLIKKSIETHFDIKIKALTSLLSYPKQLARLIEIEDHQQFLKQFFAFSFNFSSFSSADSNNSKQKEQKQQNAFLHNIATNIDELDSIIKVIEVMAKQKTFIDEKVLELFPLNFEKTKKFRPFFVQAYKAPCMEITLTTATMNTSSSQRILALEPCLTSNKKVKRWKVKITKLSSWIGVGACHINKIKQANWSFNYSEKKHGSYFISSNGYAWSSFKPQFNSKFQPFAFKTGDIITVEYHPRQNVLKYEKEDDKKNYTLQVEQNGDPLYPAINLTGVGDSVQLLY